MSTPKKHGMTVMELKSTKFDYWSKEKTLLLIEKFKGFPELWDTSSTHYRDRERKRKSLLAIADSVQADIEEVNRKWHNLRCQMNAEIRKLIKKQNEQGGHTVFRSNWLYFEALDFVIEQYRPNSRRGGEEVDLPSRAGISALGFPQANVPAIEERAYMVPEWQMPTPSTKRIITEKRKFKEERNSQQDPLDRVFAMLEKPVDDCQIFGDFVAMEMRNMHSEEKRKRLKRMIQWDLLLIQDPDNL